MPEWSLSDKIGSFIFIKQLQYCGCDECYGRYLFREESWYLMVTPCPIPRFYYEPCEWGWRFGLGWFRLAVKRGNI